MTWDELSKIHITLNKKFFAFMIFFYLRIVALILYRATIRLLLLVKEKKRPILTFLKFYVALHEILASI